MVTLRIVNLDLGSSVTHDATDWQVANDPLFEDIILESNEDHDHLTFISWDDVLDPTKKYYARARALLSTGYTIWGNIDVFTPYDINDVEIDIERPTLITNPIISTGYDANKHPNSLFAISLSNYSAVSSATLEATTWIIEDINGKPLYINKEDRINKTELKIDRLILKNNEVYRLKAMYHASSGDISNIATKTIVINPYSKSTLKTSLNDVKSGIDLQLLLEQINSIDSSQWELYQLSDNIVTKVWDLDTDSPYEAIIDGDIIKLDSRYILRYRCNLDDDNIWNYEVFYTYE